MKIQQVETCKNVSFYIATFGMVLFLSFSSLLIGAASGESMQVLKISNFKDRLDLRTPGAAVAVAWSPDGSRLAAASFFGRDLSVWDDSGHLINHFQRIGGGPAVGGSIAFIDGSSKLIFLPPDKADDSVALSIWDVLSGQIVGEIIGPEPDRLYGLNRGAHFAVSPNQTLLVSATLAGGKVLGLHGNLLVYNILEKKPLEVFKIFDGIYSLCIFGDGKFLAVGSANGFTTVIGLTTEYTVKKIRAYDQSKFGNIILGSVAGSPDGQFLIVGVGLSILYGDFAKSAEGRAWEDSIESIRLLRVADGSRIASFALAQSPIRQVGWDPKGRYAAFIDNHHSLFIWQPMISGNTYQKIDVPGLTLSLAISPSGDDIAVTTDNGISIFTID